MIDFNNIDNLISQLKDFALGNKPSDKPEINTKHDSLQDAIKSITDVVSPKDKKPIIKEDKPFPKVLENVRYQAPIKGAFYNSGNFSLSQSDKSHPKGHKGVDLRASGGTPIYPIAPGIVTAVGTDPMGGNVLNIDHQNGVTSYYAHCASVSVHKGDKVGYDTEVAKLGSSGNAAHTAPHLHLQIWKSGSLQNPASYFTVPPYTNMGKEEKMWLSDKAKEDASAFDMKKHVAVKSKIAYPHSYADKLIALGATFEIKLTKI